mmetsp:Transcript_18685/g.27583  ORF Transcript_18685/g.27583 Transcript_18685/m.27583 type:complete len:676 (+) Transcript_18685:57-2084(+)
MNYDRFIAFIFYLCLTSSFSFQLKHSNTLVLTKSQTRLFCTNHADEIKELRESEKAAVNGRKLGLKEAGEELNKIWVMSLPFFREDKKAKVMLAAVIGLTLANSGVSVAFSYIGRDFWNALSLKDQEQFWVMLQKFFAALLAGVPITVFYKYEREKLALYWREWMTNRVMDIYYAEQTYYALEAEREIDNPDQRIADDVRYFTKVSLEFLITILTSLVDLFSFSLILYKIYPQLFLAIIAYAGFGTALTAKLGSPLVTLNVDQLQKEADFRYSLIRLRENSESIAFYRGESVELNEIQRRLKSSLDNFMEILKTQRNLEFFTVAYRYLIQVLPGFVVAPLYFKGSIELGVVSQSFGAFNHILGDLSIIINQFEKLSHFVAGIERLDSFLNRMAFDQGRYNPAQPTENAETSHILSKPIVDDMKKKYLRPTLNFPGIEVNMKHSAPLSIKNVTLATPGGSRVLVENLTFDLPKDGKLLVVGQSGAGKSSLLRAVAGLWGAGSGTIERPPLDQIFFLPQKPYCTLGTLRDQITYPHRKEGEPENEELLDLLVKVGLPNLAKLAGKGDEVQGLNSVKDWSAMLSLGEQQRLAFARLIYNEPKLGILDEATSALDLECERRMYELLVNIEGLSYLSVGHRPSLLQYHNMKLSLRSNGSADIHLLENIKHSDQVPSAMHL